MNGLNSIPNFKEERQIKNMLLSKIDQLTNLHPSMSFAQHMSTIMRKGEKGKDPYFWTNKECLSKIEKYMDALEMDPPKVSFFEKLDEGEGEE